MEFFSIIDLCCADASRVFLGWNNDYDDDVDDLEPSDYEDDIGDYVERQDDCIEDDCVDYLQ